MWTLKKILFVCLSLFVMIVVFLFQNSKEKDEYLSITGYVEFMENSYKGFPKRNLGKYRYLKVDGYPYPFELFVGKDAGDFKPKFEQIDKLKQGDLVTVYYYETDNTHEEQINRFVQFVDKEGVSFFEIGNVHKVLGYFMLFLIFLLAVGGYVLYKKGKITL